MPFCLFDYFANFKEYCCFFILTEHQIIVTIHVFGLILKVLNFIIVHISFNSKEFVSITSFMTQFTYQKLLISNFMFLLAHSKLQFFNLILCFH